MTFDLRRVKESAPVVRVVIAATRGSVPRDVGAAMYVSARDVIDTIGGGALEYEAIETARSVLRSGVDRLETRPLGPSLGQCCGGSVTLLFEYWDAERVAGVSDALVVRPLPEKAPNMPLPVQRVLSEARSSGILPEPQMLAGWMIEPVAHPGRHIWIWGAGHVGRAITNVLAPLPDLAVHWADTGRERFPVRIPDRVETLVAENPADLVSLAPDTAEHLVLTFSHALDLEICHRVLSRPFRSLGLIGSATKRARFRSRLVALGHKPTQIDRMICPIGDPALGKHPQALALGVAAALLKSPGESDMTRNTGT